VAIQDVAFDEADLAPISSASSAEQLQEAMDVARLAANAQRDIEAEGGNPLEPAEEEAEQETPESGEQPEEPAEEEPAEEAQEPEEQTEEEPTEGEEAQSRAPPEEPPPKKGEPAYSRRDAARFKSELDARTAELQQTRGQLQRLQATDASIIRQIAEQAGSEDEFRQLTSKVISGAASDEERQRANIMQQWRQVAGPIYRQAQVQVLNDWAQAFTGAGNFDGMTDDSRQQIQNGATPLVALETIHAAGVQAGVAQARAEQKKAQAEIQRLKAEVSSLKTRQVTAKPQPAAPDGVTPATSSRLPPMLLEDGSLNPEFEKLAHSGKLYGVEKLTG